MTGRDEIAAELLDKKISVKIRSLSSKVTDLPARITPAYREKEMELRNEIVRVLGRGKTNFSLWMGKKGCAEVATPINQVLVEGYYNQIEAIPENLYIVVSTDWFQTLLHVPGVMTRTETQGLSEEEWGIAYATVKEAVPHLVNFHKRRGAALEKKFREEIEDIRRLLKSVTPYKKKRVDKVKERIIDALEKTLSVNYDKNRLGQELIYYIEKLDINEEKQRLSSHLECFISTLENGSGQGKKLGFVVQEMGREINTLGSKSNHAEMQKIVVQMKGELGQIKEQVLDMMQQRRIMNLTERITIPSRKDEVKIIIFSAPSGLGKSIIIDYLLGQQLNPMFSISTTNCPPRGSEKHGIEYFFLIPDEFRQYIASSEFLKYEEVYIDRFYGTLKEQVKKQLTAGQNVVSNVDAVGGRNIKKFHGDRASSPFIQPPCIKELRRRLIGHDIDAPEIIESKIAKAEYESGFVPKFDKVIIDDDLATAEAQALEVIKELLGIDTE